MLVISESNQIEWVKFNDFPSEISSEMLTISRTLKKKSNHASDTRLILVAVISCDRLKVN